MIRNLDLATLRSLVAVVDTGGVTRAANRLHLTQSAVSMQIKRLEDALSLKVLERRGRNMHPTRDGEALVAYARRLVALNDEAVERLTTPRHEGAITFGVPTDIVHPHVPAVLIRFGRTFPRVAIRLVTGHTVDLKAAFDDGRRDVILTTERHPAPDADVLWRRSLIWTGAPGGRAWRARPLPLAFARECMFKSAVTTALEDAGIDWFDAIDTHSEDAATVSAAADIGLHADLLGSLVQGLAPIDHGGALPPLPEYCVGLYVARGGNEELARPFAELLREAFAAVDGGSGSRAEGGVEAAVDRAGGEGDEASRLAPCA